MAYQSCAAPPRKGNDYFISKNQETSKLEPYAKYTNGREANNLIAGNKIGSNRWASCFRNELPLVSMFFYRIVPSTFFFPVSTWNQSAVRELSHFRFPFPLIRSLSPHRPLQISLSQIGHLPKRALLHHEQDTLRGQAGGGNEKRTIVRRSHAGPKQHWAAPNGTRKKIEYRELYLLRLLWQETGLQENINNHSYFRDSITDIRRQLNW